MCEHGSDVLLEVPVASRLSHDSKAKWAYKPVDACIAPIVQALNVGGVYTAASCCGHGKGPGSIILLDGRELTITERK